MVKVFESGTFLSNVITEEEMKNWKGNVILDCGTAAGKTTLILDKLSLTCYEPFKRILILSSRDALKEEINMKIANGLLVNVHVESYQYIENGIRNGVTDKLDIFKQKWNWIVLDEVQHMIEGISTYTDLSFEWVMNHSAQKIFMSATAKPLYQHLLKNKHVSTENYYYIPKSYHYVDDIYFFKKKSDVEYIVADLMQNTNDKIIVFVNDIEECLKLYKQYEGDATFYCSKHTKNESAKKLLNEQPYKIKDEQFSTRLLIATCALDVGITLKDYSIKHVVASVFNHSQLTQCLGRKREITEYDKRYDGEADTCTFYIREYNKGDLNLLNKSNELEELNLFKKDRKEWERTYGSDRKHKNENIYYDFQTEYHKINELGYINVEQHQKDIYSIGKEVVTINGTEQEGKGYKQFIIDELKFPIEKVKEYEVVKVEKQQQSLAEYLDSITGKPLFKQEQLELKEVFKVNGLQARTLGINTLNGNLIDRKSKFRILPKTSSKRIEGKVKSFRYWEVVSNVSSDYKV